MYFFTVVTYTRQPILCLEESRTVLREVIRDVKLAHPFGIKAWVLLPEHIHCIWELPKEDFDYSMRWGLIKREFTKRIKCRITTAITQSRISHRESNIWQRRFWEHRIRDDADYRAHFDYIHYNPVKHGLVACAKDWAYSTFHRYLKSGVYTEDWGGSEIKFPDGIGGE